MAKSRSGTRSPRKKTASARKSAPTPKPAAKKKKRGFKGDVVQLKPLYEQIGLTILELETLGPNEQAESAIEQLEACRAEFIRMCGPTMDIPRGAILA